MARTANRFTNPVNGVVYDWPINHSDEDEVGRDRGVTYEGNTGNVGLVAQQGELTPIVLRYTGTILTYAQLTGMIGWFNLCQTQTIYFTDFAGDSYEVIITAFKPKRLRAMRNPRGGTQAPTHYWTYSIEMSVLRVLSGEWVGSPA
jgi:hypothetical protein